MPTQRLVSVPQDIPAADVLLPEDPDAERKEFGKGAEKSVYKYVGDCAQCGIQLFRWESGPHVDNLLGQNLAVYVASGHRNPPSLFCNPHDPNAEHRTKTVVLPTPDRPKLGDTWRPRALS